MILGNQPGRGDLLLGRVGPSMPRVPTAITTPGNQGILFRQRGITAPEPLPAPRAPLYGSLELPDREDEEGPASGLTLDQAIERLVGQNLDLLSKRMEIPQARADILTASLRANPILYADSQLVPYGSFNDRRPGGPTQYDLNMSHPLDYSHKRRARINYSTQALKVTEAQYQDVVRLEINNLSMAFIDVLAARQTVWYTRASVAGLERLLRATELLYQRDINSRADVNQVQAQKQTAEVSLLDAEENLRRAKRTLGMMLNLPPAEAEDLEVRGTIQDRGPPPPPVDELIGIALSLRPDVASYRLGIELAESGVNLMLANRYQDAYLLYQPYTFQNNAPFGKQSATSWALGMTFPLPLYNRNQGNIERAKLNVTQSHMELEAIQRRVVTEVVQAAREYEVSGEIVRRIKDQILPASRTMTNDRYKLFARGEANVISYLDAQRAFNDNVKIYLDTMVRHRRGMLGLNTALGQRILP
jgi:cobalt-zinc-cadmium efflux system outer membrane protein